MASDDKNDQQDSLLPQGRSRKASLPISRWQTPEMILYILIILVAYLFFMIPIPIALSQENSKTYPSYMHRLKPGWIFGRQVDDSDTQYRAFRSHIFQATSIAILHVSISRLSRFLFPDWPQLYRYITLTFSVSFLLILHGPAGCIRLGALLALNYFLTKYLAGKVVAPVLVWTLNIGLLIASESYLTLFKFGEFFEGWSVLDSNPSWVLTPRWWESYNFLMLRIISFFMDYHWLKNGLSEINVESHTKKCPDCQRGIICDQARIDASHPEDDYNFSNFVNYALYAPLYRAGPIVTFNDFLSQVKQPSQKITFKLVCMYALRWVSVVLLMEVMLHYMYVVAIKDAHAWEGFTPLEFGLIGYWNLKIVWLKLLIVWRFFRLWAMADGILAPENMSLARSVSRNDDLRVYVYVPLGGNKTGPIGYLVNSWLIFTFVAIWHDRELKLLAWGWLIVLFIMPEVLATRFTVKWRSRVWYRHLAALGGACNMFTMAVANLVGFVVGVDGISYLIGGFFSLQGLPLTICMMTTLFAAVQVMFEIRESEKRRGIVARY
ncbi:hypothetical protein SmJEL517_g01496 [Synchytrium microbalum]|uniref:Uncharacterized protein n=1 Tax=Synchytrium microbalum TaxID=1806994 RepID=A0A507C9P7_9FUNG|nr:uncharacterized protein SmJEL517_g01496 [Synchytrium microbalum]TPX36201.1 hypothetical protein SmJEL517_g01496 [Synchytrium microbalum]